MKKLFICLVALATLASCSGGVEKLGDKTSYNGLYSSEPNSFNYLTNNKSSNGDIYNNFVEGLVIQDSYGKLVPGMAESWSSNDDKTEFTFKIRKGAKWTDGNGKSLAGYEVTAHDFVAGLRFAVEGESSTLWLVSDVIKGLADYEDGNVSWDEVGVEAVDDYTLKYTLTGPTPYFVSMTTYSILFPVNQEFLESKGEGCKLGAVDIENCEFGTVDKNGILYNSAYLLDSYTSGSELSFKKNENYWDKENVFVETVKLICVADNEDPDVAWKFYEKGEIDSAGLRPANAELFASIKESNGDNIYVSETGTTCYWVSINVDRQAFANYNDPTALVSQKSDQEKADTKTALLNQNFRLALLSSISAKNYNAVTLGDEYAATSIRNTVVAPTFCKTSTKFYGDLLQEKLREYEGFEDVNLADGQDAYYNPTKAKAYLEKAKAELGGSVSFPIKLDILALSTLPNTINRANSIKESIESSLGSENVQVLINIADTSKQYQAAFYTIDTGDQANYDIQFQSGWGPDYEDPRTYLNIFLSDKGDMLHSFGLNNQNQASESGEAAKEIVGLTEYTKLAKAADAILENDERVEKFAEAEAYLLSIGVVRPFTTSGGTPGISNVIPFTQAYGQYGWGSYNNIPIFKYMQVSSTVVSNAAREERRAKWLEGQKG